MLLLTPFSRVIPHGTFTRSIIKACFLEVLLQNGWYRLMNYVFKIHAKSSAISSKLPNSKTVNLTPYWQFDGDGKHTWSNLMLADWAWMQAVCHRIYIDLYSIHLTFHIG